MNSSAIRAGVTLIEIVAALLLASLLFAALIGVARNVSNYVSAAEQRFRSDWHNAFIDILQRDLMASESLWAVDGSIFMAGALPVYASSNQVTNRTIAFCCVSYGGEFGSVLVRYDRGLPGHIAAGPVKLKVERLDDDGYPQPLPHAPGPIPKRVRIWIWESLDGQPVLQRDLVI